MRTGTETLAKICGQKWPRLLPLTWAAAYCGMNLARFKAVSELSALIFNVGGIEVVDKQELDNYIDKIKTPVYDAGK